MKTSIDRRCSAITKAGRPCLSRPVRDSDPPLCAAHGGCEASRPPHPRRDKDEPRDGRRPVGAPEGNKNALKHAAFARSVPAKRPETALGAYGKADGPPSLNGRISDLDSKIQQLASYIDTHDFSFEQYVSLLDLYGQLNSRLGRLQRDHRAISDEAAGGIAGAIAQAYDELGEEQALEN